MASTTIILALAIALTPGAATVSKDLSNSAPVGASASAPATASKAQATKYCITVGAFTGTRLGRTECKTREQWTKEGVDVDHPDRE